MNVRIVIRKAETIARFRPKFLEAQRFLDNEVLKDSTPYVPRDSGALMRSGIAYTIPGSGQVKWNTKYARICYYKNRRYRKTHHPLATSKWFEHAKAANKEKWISGVKQIMKG